MSGLYLALKWLHVISSSVLFGTSLGIVFFWVRAQSRGDIRVIAAVSRQAVLADACFTLSAVILQPVTGAAMAAMGGGPASGFWLRAAIVIYSATGVIWVPVLWLQLRMRKLAQHAANAGTGLPAAYHRCYRWWLALRCPEFAALLVIFYLMIAKPA